MIREWRPDVVITSDDNAAKHLVKAYYRDAELPIVFCGVNWTVEEYGFPYKNVTGMVEVAPIRPMLLQAIEILDTCEDVYYIGASTLTEEKNSNRIEKLVHSLGFTLTIKLASTLEEWVQAYDEAQSNAELIILGSNSGINDWNSKRVLEHISKTTRQLSVTNHEWMMPYSMIGYTKIPEEHGEWSAKVALSVLEGMNIEDMPIVTNRKWDLWLNKELIESSTIKIPRTLYRTGKEFINNESIIP